MNYTILHSFHRPIGVGIYGHPSYDVSEYLLEAFYLEEEIDHFLIDTTEFEDKIDRDNFEGSPVKVIEILYKIIIC